MTAQQIDTIAQQRTQAIVLAIQNFIQKGGHAEKGAINLVLISERTGIKNLGKVLQRKGISMRTIFRILVAIDEIAIINQVDTSALQQDIVDAFNPQ